MNGVIVLMSMAAMMVIPLALGVGAGYLALQGLLEALRIAVTKAEPMAVPVRDNVITGSFSREAQSELPSRRAA